MTFTQIDSPLRLTFTEVDSRGWADKNEDLYWGIRGGGGNLGANPNSETLTGSNLRANSESETLAAVERVNPGEYS